MREAGSNHTLQPTVLPPLRYGKPAAERGRWGSMRKSARPLMALALLLPLSALADTFHKLVKYRCDPASDALVVSYVGAYNEAGEEMLRSAGADDFDPWKLLEIKDDGIRTEVKTIKSVTRSCNLSDGSYQIDVRGNPGNANLHGECGAGTTAIVSISLDGNPIYQRSFEGRCHSETLVLTGLKLVPGKPLSLTEVPPDEFFR